MTFDADSRQGPKTTLQSMEVHSVWARQFRSGENNRFFSLAFDYIARAFGPPTGAPVVDAGCGSGTKSLQLARRGYRVEALDFSTAILESARTMAEELGYDSQIRFATADRPHSPSNRTA
jgi:2-polyprenyl-3-methyl-5-hydroxy-6-metoxy-1,4-benzoquinol methylase